MESLRDRLVGDKQRLKQEIQNLDNQLLEVQLQINTYKTKNYIINKKPLKTLESYQNVVERINQQKKELQMKK